MGAYDDLIPGPPRRSAYADLLPGGAPAAAEQPAEVASPGASATPGTPPREPDLAGRDRVKTKSPLVETIKQMIGTAADEVPAAAAAAFPATAPVAPLVRRFQELTATPEPKGVLEAQSPRQTATGKIGVLPFPQRVEDYVPPRAPTTEPAPLARAEALHPDTVTVGGGSRLDALKALPRMAGDAIVGDVAGLGRIVGDVGSDLNVPGADRLANRARELARQSERSNIRTMAPFEDTGAEKRVGPGDFGRVGDVATWFGEPKNIAQVGAQAPQLAGVAASLMGLSPAATLLVTMGLPVTGRSYDEYREKGYDAPVALLGALGQAATETIPEAAWIKYARSTRLADLRGFTKMAPEEQRSAVTGLLKGYGILGASEIGQEEVSTIGNWLVSKAMQDPTATLESLKQDMADTVRQTALFAPVMAGTAHAGQALQQRAAEAAQRRAQDSRVLDIQQDRNAPVNDAQSESIRQQVAAATQPPAPPVVRAPPVQAQEPVAPAPAASVPLEVKAPVQEEMALGLPEGEAPKPVQVPATPIDAAQNVQEMREAARTYAKANFNGSRVKNGEKGWDIVIPGNGVRHATANAEPDDLRVVPVLPELLASGRYLGSEADEKPSPDRRIKAFHFFESVAEHRGDVMKVRLVVREMPNGRFFYDHAVTEKKTPDGTSVEGEDRSLPRSQRPASGADESVDLGDDTGNLGMPAHVPVGAAQATGAAAATVTPPAAVAGAGAMPPQAGTKQVPAAQARPDAIKKAAQELFGAPINEKHQSRGSVGTYRVKPQTIRLKNRNDLRTMGHEVGHHLSETNKPFRTTMKQYGAELIPMMPAAYKPQAAAGKMSRKLQIEEGFAEFFAEYLTDRKTARTKAPGFFKEFEQWLDRNPHYKAAVKQVSEMIEAHQGLGPAEKILAKVGVYKPTIAENVAAAFSKDTWHAAVQATLDKWHPAKLMVADLAPGLAPSKNPYMALRLLAGDSAVVEDWLHHFGAPFDYQKRLDPKNYGKPLLEVLAPVLDLNDQEINAFKAYLIARRASELMKVGKENLFTPQEIAAGLKLETPLFKKVAAEVYAYNDRLLDYAVEGGLLAPEVAKQFKEYAAYIPFFREREGEAKPGGGKGQPFKKLTGGTQNVRDPIANLIQNTANIVYATNRNAAMQKLAALAKAVPGGGRWAESVPVPKEAQQVATQQIIDELKKQGVQVDTTMAQSLATLQTFFKPTGKGDDRTRTMVYKDGGELKAVQVNDPLLWKAVGNLPPLELGLIGKMLAFPAQTLRAGVVLDPTFMVRNFVRDTLSAMIQSRGTFLPVLGTAQGMKMMAQMDDAYKLWRAFGGSMSDQFQDPDEAAATIKRMAKRGGFSPSSIISPQRLLDALKKVGSFTESGSRIGEFHATYQPGDFESALQAALNSREVSTDFGMRGGADWLQVLTKITPFMNPAMQGLYKGARVLSGADGRALQVKAALIGTAMGLASIWLALHNSDEPWYQALEEWEKVTYWHFKVGKEIYRIPKPFEYGNLFASAPEAIALLAAGKENGEDFKKRMLQVLGNLLGFRVIPQAATIVAEPWANKSFFTGRKIVPDKNQNLEPGVQANPSTSKTAQVVGEAANVSPALIDNVVRNVFGTLGVHAVAAADTLLEKTGVVAEGREKTWRQWPVIKAFVHDPDNPNSKQMRDFYDDLEKYRRAVATVKHYKTKGDEAKADQYGTEKADDIDQAKEAERVAKKLAKIRRAVAGYEASRDMTPAEKRTEINAENEEGQAIVEEFQATVRASRATPKDKTQLYRRALQGYAEPEGVR